MLKQLRQGRERLLALELELLTRQEPELVRVFVALAILQFAYYVEAQELLAI